MVVRGVSWCWTTGQGASVWKHSPLRGAGGREGMSGPGTSISPTSPVRCEAPMGASRCFRAHPLALEAFQVLHEHTDRSSPSWPNGSLHVHQLHHQPDPRSQNTAPNLG